MSTYKPPSHMAQALEYKGPGALRGEEKKTLGRSAAASKGGQETVWQRRRALTGARSERPTTVFPVLGKL